ncbi:hypothetical protein HDZ31DRAFT_60654 [Schizophyllum fasciatum]
MTIDVKTAISYLREMTGLIDGSDECTTIETADTLLAEKEERRQQELEEATKKYKAQAKLLEQARKSSTRPASLPTAEAHAAAMNELEDARINLQKAASDLDDKQMATQASLALWRKKLASLNELDQVSQHLEDVDSSVLRLQFFRGLGFEPLLDEDLNLSKVLVRSHFDEDIYPVEIARDDVSYANELWSLAGSRGENA